MSDRKLSSIYDWRRFSRLSRGATHYIKMCDTSKKAREQNNGFVINLVIPVMERDIDKMLSYIKIFHSEMKRVSVGTMAQAPPALYNSRNSLHYKIFEDIPGWYKKAKCNVPFKEKDTYEKILKICLSSRCVSCPFWSENKCLLQGNAGNWDTGKIKKIMEKENGSEKI